MSTRSPLRPLLLPLVLLLAPGLAGGPALADSGAWAVLVNGDDSPVHRRNVAVAAEALRDRGWSSDRIRIVGLTEPAAPPGDVVAPVRATLDELVGALEEIHRAAGANAPVLLYLTGHATRLFGNVNVHLERGSLGRTALERALESLGGRDVLLIVDTCYSGAFADLETPGGRLVVVTSTDPRHQVLCSGFIRPFWAAVRHVGSDRDGDGQIRLREVWDVTREAIPVRQADDAPRPGLRGDPSWFSFGPTSGSARLATGNPERLAPGRAGEPSASTAEPSRPSPSSARPGPEKLP